MSEPSDLEAERVRVAEERFAIRCGRPEFERDR
jgi:hypothetical protein